MFAFAQNSLSMRVFEKTLPIPSSWRSLSGFVNGIQKESTDMTLPIPIFWKLECMTVHRLVFPHFNTYSPKERHLLVASFCSGEDIRFIGCSAPLMDKSKRWQKRFSFAESQNGCWELVQHHLGNIDGCLGEIQLHRSALQNHPKPIGLGGWFSTARSMNLSLKRTKINQ